MTKRMHILFLALSILGGAGAFVLNLVSDSSRTYTDVEALALFLRDGVRFEFSPPLAFLAAFTVSAAFWAYRVLASKYVSES